MTGPGESRVGHHPARPPVTRAMVGRYAAFQVPGFILAVIVGWLAWQQFGVDGRLVAAALAAWLVKDVVLFPFVRVAYAPRDERGPGGLRGAAAVVVDALAPQGRVRIGGELWRARLREGTGPVAPGARVRVADLDGLTVLVDLDEGA